MGGSWSVRLVMLVAWTCVMVGHVPRARADQELIAKARSEMEALDYPAARTSLARALASGNNGRAELVEIYKMQGSVHGALGEVDASSRAFTHMLALAPGTTLEDGTSPKITERLQIASEFFATRKPLQIRTETSLEPTAVTLLVDSDPLSMVVTAQVWFVADTKPEATLKVSGIAPITIPLPEASKLTLRVAALDLYGNRLFEIDGLVIAHAPAAAPVAPVAPAVPVVRRPLYTKWWLWGGAAVAFAGAGTYFGLAMRSDRDAHDALKASSPDHRYSEAYEVETSMRRNALFANISFGAAGVAALAATYFLLTTPPAHTERTAVAPVVMRGGGGVALAVPF